MLYPWRLGVTGPLSLRRAPGSVTFGRKKARAFPVGKLGHFETRILRLPSQSSVTVWLQHSRRPAESQDPFRFLRHNSKMGRLPPKCLRHPFRLSADQGHRQRTTLTTYAMLLPGSPQASGPVPSFTESAQTINDGFFIQQYTNFVNACFDILSSRSMQNGGHTTPFVTPLLPNIVRPNLLRPNDRPILSTRKRPV